MGRALHTVNRWDLPVFCLVDSLDRRLFNMHPDFSRVLPRPDFSRVLS